MIVGMVDDRAMRFRQQAAAPAPRFSAPSNYRYGEASAPRAAKPNVVTDFLNPLPSVTSAISEGRAPKGSDLAVDAGLLAAGFIPFAGPGIRTAGLAARGNSLAKAMGQQPRAIETAATQAQRVTDRDILLNELGPQAIYEFLQSPVTGYRNTLNAPLLRRFFAETPERIPKGTEMYRAPSKGQVEGRLPTTPGEVYAPGQVMSTGGSADLQKLGEVLGGRNLGDLTGGNQHYAPGLMRIEAMEDLPGIPNINTYLDRYAGQYGGRARGPIAGTSDFANESTLGPTVQYLLRRFEPAVGDTPPTWYFNAYGGR